MHDSSWEKLLHHLLKRLTCVKRKKAQRYKKANLYSEEQLNQQHLFLSVYLLDRFFLYFVTACTHPLLGAYRCQTTSKKKKILYILPVLRYCVH